MVQPLLKLTVLLNQSNKLWTSTLIRQLSHPKLSGSADVADINSIEAVNGNGSIDGTSPNRHQW